MKMRLIAVILMLLTSALWSKSSARDGYKVDVHFTDVKKEKKIFLCNYYGEAGGKAYRIDSLILKNGKGTFQSKEKIVGGIYLLLFKDQTANMEFILLNGNRFSIQAEKTNIPATASFKGKSENSLFYKYQRYLVDFGKKNKDLRDELAQAKSKKDSTRVTDKMIKKSKGLNVYREKIIQDQPKRFLSKLFLALKEPKVPEPDSWPILDNGTKDSSYPRKYYQTHYWDDFDFQDDRLMYTPIYGSKLGNYINKWVEPDPDSVSQACAEILSKAEGTEHLFKFSLWYLTRWAETSKYMGMDEVFVYLVEDNHMKGKTPWLSEEQLQKYIKKCKRIAPNILGEPAQDLALYTIDNRKINLSSVQADYTLLIFYSATCGHCKKELPLIDSLYKSDLHKYDMKILAMETTNQVEKWKKLVKEKELTTGWIHTYDPQVETNYKEFYNAYTNPTIYMLDKDKNIVGKRVNHANLIELMQYLEKKKTN